MVLRQAAIHLACAMSHNVILVVAMMSPLDLFARESLTTFEARKVQSLAAAPEHRTLETAGDFSINNEWPDTGRMDH